MQRGSRKYPEALVNTEHFHMCHKDWPEPIYSTVSQSIREYYRPGYQHTTSFPRVSSALTPVLWIAHLKISTVCATPTSGRPGHIKGEKVQGMVKGERRVWWPNQQRLLGKVGEDVNSQRTMPAEVPSRVVTWLSPMWADLTGSSTTPSGPVSWGCCWVVIAEKRLSILRETMKTVES